MRRRLMKIAALPFALWREKRRWRDCRRDGQPRVYYGFESLPSRAQSASGGIIKCQDLQLSFPNITDCPNLLYLVSSSLPTNASRIVALARRYGGRVILNQNGVAYPGWHGKGWERANRRLSEVLQQADFVVYQSSFCKMAADRFLGVREAPWSILHNAVATDVFKPALDRPALRRPVILLAAGSHSQSYRVAIPLAVLQHLRANGVDARLRIAGRFRWHPDEARAQRELLGWIAEQRLENAVDVIGAYSQEQAPALLGAADILLHAKYNDACPRLVAEALACALPVVYSASGGTPELVGQDAGIGLEAPLDWERARPPDAKAMADAVVRIMASYDRFSRAARQRAVERLDVRSWVEQHRRVFAQLAAE